MRVDADHDPYPLRTPKHNCAQGKPSVCCVSSATGDPGVEPDAAVLETATLAHATSSEDADVSFVSSSAAERQAFVRAFQLGRLARYGSRSFPRIRGLTAAQVRMPVLSATQVSVFRAGVSVALAARGSRTGFTRFSRARGWRRGGRVTRRPFRR